jgi:hypothetical protein
MRGRSNRSHSFFNGQHTFRACWFSASLCELGRMSWLNDMRWLAGLSPAKGHSIPTYGTIGQFCIGSSVRTFNANIGSLARRLDRILVLQVHRLMRVVSINKQRRFSATYRSAHNVRHVESVRTAAVILRCGSAMHFAMGQQHQCSCLGLQMNASMGVSRFQGFLTKFFAGRPPVLGVLL